MAKKPILFYLSAGHGGSDPGAVSGKFVEADMARTVMAACYKELLAPTIVICVHFPIVSRFAELSNIFKCCHSFSPVFAKNVVQFVV